MPDKEEFLSAKNPYYPIPIKLTKSLFETEDRQLKTLHFQFVNPQDRFEYKAGQFCQLSIFDIGEAPFGIASCQYENQLMFTINRIGTVTEKLHLLSEGDIIGIRGALGNCYPVDIAKGKDILIVSGGYAFTTLRSLLLYLTSPQNRKNYGKITILYGVREPGLFLYKDELKEWKGLENVEIHLTIDKPYDGWDGYVGLIPDVLRRIAPEGSGTIAYVCGPPIMLKFTFPVLDELGFAHSDVYTSLEMRMKCGIGKCGRCNLGTEYICHDGPVFSLEQLNKLQKD